MARRVRRDAAILFPGVGAQLVATTGAFVLPFVVGALISGAGFDEQSAGFLISFEAIAAALTTVALSAASFRRSRRAFAVGGALLAIVGNAAALVTPDLASLVAARLAAGVGAGIVVAEVAAVVARARDRERLISALTIAAVLNGSIWLYVIPHAPPELGYRGPYLALLLTCVVGVFFLPRLPSPPVRRASAVHAAAASGSGALGLAVLPAIFLTQLGQGSFWTLVAIYGANAGLSEEAIGGFLSMATLLLLVGVVGTGITGTKLGRFGPLFMLTIVNVGSIVAIAFSTDPTVYVAANVIQAVTNLSSVVYQLGLAAAVDRSGRLFAAANGLVALGNGVGPAVAGSLSLYLGAPAVGVAVAFFNLVALLLYAAVGAGVARKSIILRA